MTTHRLLSPIFCALLIATAASHAGDACDYLPTKADAFTADVLLTLRSIERQPVDLSLILARGNDSRVEGAPIGSGIMIGRGKDSTPLY